VWSGGPVQVNLAILLERVAALYRFSFFLWRCSSGYGTVEKVKGVVRSFLLSPVCCQFFWRLDVCGRILVLYISIFFGRFVVLLCGFLLRKLLIFNNLLQVVPSQSELGGGPGTSA
jgi:hypothetical protein